MQMRSRARRVMSLARGGQGAWPRAAPNAAAGADATCDPAAGAAFDCDIDVDLVQRARALVTPSSTGPQLNCSSTATPRTQTQPCRPRRAQQRSAPGSSYPLQLAPRPLPVWMGSSCQRQPPRSSCAAQCTAAEMQQLPRSMSPQGRSQPGAEAPSSPDCTRRLPGLARSSLELAAQLVAEAAADLRAVLPPQASSTRRLQRDVCGDCRFSA